MDPSENQQTVFISYSKHDEEWKDFVVSFLNTLDVYHGAEIWADNRIPSGEEWYAEIQKVIGRTAVAILLVTEHFLGTSFIAKDEIPYLLARRERMGMKLIPLLVHDCPWGAVRWLRKLQLRPPKGKSLNELSATEKETLLGRLVEEIGEFLESWGEQTPIDDFAEHPAPGETVHARATTSRLEHDWPAALAKVKIDLRHLPRTGYTLFGRDKRLDALDSIWDSPELGHRVIALIAGGGVGKSILINRWLCDLQADGWRGATHVFGWSFFSQGAHDQLSSADTFIDQALRFFDDPHPEAGSPTEKGERLAGLANAKRTLLVLDGMEPLQSAHGFDRGRIRDPGLRALLRELAHGDHGLCLISTREPVSDLDGEDGFKSIDLERITPQNGRALLAIRGVIGTDEEKEKLAEDFGPRALSISLLGNWLYLQPDHAAAAAKKLPRKGEPVERILTGFELWMGEGSERELLRLQGLFDRPASAALLSAVRGGNDVPGLFKALPPFSQEDARRVRDEHGKWGPWQGEVERLRNMQLLAPHNSQVPDVLESHLLIREHFAKRLRVDHPRAWRAAHRRIYEYLVADSAPQPDTLADLEPLYQAVRHGCNSGEFEGALRVMRERIWRGKECYSSRKLGAFAANLAALRCFFEVPWHQPALPDESPGLPWLLGETGEHLRALGLLDEARSTLQKCVEVSCEQKNWVEASDRASGLSRLDLTLGRQREAKKEALKAVNYAKKSEDALLIRAIMTTLADVFHQSGCLDKAAKKFKQARGYPIPQESKYTPLYSFWFFRECEFLLGKHERTAWKCFLGLQVDRKPQEDRELDKIAEEGFGIFGDEWQAVKRLDKSTGFLPRLDEALDLLSRGRARLYQIVLSGSTREPDALQHVLAGFGRVVKDIEDAGMIHHVPRGLLFRSWLRFLVGDEKRAGQDLQKAQKIAEGRHMQLHLADIYLYRARLFKDCTALAEADKLVKKHGYFRRKSELRDARRVL